jgi:hypothetical protein
MNYLNNRQKHSELIVRNRAYRQAIERLDEALEKNNPWDNSAKIAAMRRAYFADVDNFGPIAMPKR